MERTLRSTSSVSDSTSVNFLTIAVSRVCERECVLWLVLEGDWAVCDAAPELC